MDPQLDDRQHELCCAFVAAWETNGDAPPHTPFDFPADVCDHPNWPPNVQPPTRDDARGLLVMGLLELDPRPAPVWRVFPSPQMRAMFDPANSSESNALSDPDRRLGLILNATIEAFNADPATPLHFTPLDQVDLVAHPGWQLQPDSVHEHDLRQLQELDLIGITEQDGEFDFWPTATANRALTDLQSFVDQLANEAATDSERSRLQRWATRLRTGDLAVSTTAATAAGILIRILLGH